VSPNEAVEKSSVDLAGAELGLQCFLELLSGYDRDAAWRGTDSGMECPSPQTAP
jgi:hypothetical protein